MCFITSCAGGNIYRYRYPHPNSYGNETISRMSVNQHSSSYNLAEGPGIGANVWSSKATKQLRGHEKSRL